MQARLEDLDALYEVVHEEVEETALDVAARVRSVRNGAGMVGRIRRWLVAAADDRPARGSSTALLGASRSGLLSTPTPAWAWTPGTHICLGETILANLHLLPAVDRRPAPRLSLRFPLRQHRARHLDRQEIRAARTAFAFLARGPGDLRSSAESDALRAFGLGYLSHLAADTIAHNYFVPRQLVLTSSTRSMGHTYWEIRVETHLGGRYARQARDIIQLDQSPADRHLERIISPTIFSVPTNRRIFRGMVHLAHTRTLAAGDAGGSGTGAGGCSPTRTSSGIWGAYDVTMEMLADDGRDGAIPGPVGQRPLRQAKQMRRSGDAEGRLVRQGPAGAGRRAQFALPSQLPGYWTRGGTSGSSGDQSRDTGPEHEP